MKKLLFWQRTIVIIGLAAIPLAAAAVLLGFAPAASAQAISVNGGSIQGTITDTSGAVIAGASVRILATDTGAVVTVTTDASGLYSVGPLNPGNYRVTISAAGFETLVVNTVIRTATATPGTFQLKVGSQTQTVEVTAGAVQLNTDQPSVTGVISSQQFESLPVNGRNVLDFAQLQPGVQLQAGGSSDGGFDPTKAGYSAVSFSGISGRTTRILLDGQDVTDETVGTTIFNISQGSIGEEQITRATADPSTEVTSQGSVLLATKSGTNSFHGEAFEYFQDQRAGVATYEDTSSPFQRNQFGGSVGGPILRDKLFFFANVERLKQDQSSPVSLGLNFKAKQAEFPSVASPDRDTYSDGRIDWNGPHATHFFVRGNYERNSFATGAVYSTYSNLDNAWGIAGGADFASSRFTNSFRGSFEKFHNQIGDTTLGNNSIYNPIPGFGIYYSAQGLHTGPNENAPQQTFQSDKQLRYDGGWTRGSHNIRYGVSLNRILGGGLAAFFGYGPRASINSGTLIGDATDPIHGYKPYYVYISNNLGYASEKEGFGLPGGGQSDWRTGLYAVDTWKINPQFTFTWGLRWDRDTGRSNSDLAPVPCSNIATDNFAFGAGSSGLPCSGDSHLFDQWGAGLGNRVSQPKWDFGPNIGIAYNPSFSQKTVLRGGFGIYYDSNVFNNVQFDRSSRLQNGKFAVYTPVCYGGNYTLGDLTETSTGISIQALCNMSLADGAPGWLQLQKDYRAEVSGGGVNSGSAAYNLAINNGAIAFAPDFKFPYSINISVGVQRELFSGAVISADYVRLETLRLGQTIDANHVGDSRYFNLASAQAAAAATLTACQVGSVDAAITACPGLHPAKNGNPAGPATIADFAARGLDSGTSYTGGYPAAAYPKRIPAFPGVNPNVGVGTFQFPEGRASYNGLQVSFMEQISHHLPGIRQSNFQASYAFSRMLSTAGDNGISAGSDPFFTSPSYNNRDTTADMGWGGFDRTHILSFGGAATFKYGPQLSLIGHLSSARPTGLTIDDQGGGPGEIFHSDYNGDGQIGDLMPTTKPGAYMRQYGPNSLNKLIDKYNAGYAGKPTPAGQTLITNNIFTGTQLAALGGVMPALDSAPSHAYPNSPLRTLDASLRYPIHFHWLPEKVNITPAVAMYNVLNFGNFGGPDGVVLTPDDNGAGLTNVNSPYGTGAAAFDIKNTERT
ncbi:MAG TPA: carboxypeptidase regulatory-like domain-containing protein, partial [Acidobacteriaceae bacterium]|nr:carboxypeptidase regulatory-like domain-containing protein [Acidobacteriaceae bacterium]